MEITAEQKALLQLVDTDLESSFSSGVTQAGPYLPALDGYTKISSNNRDLGRKGILSTFASLLSRLTSFSPAVVPMTLQSGVYAWPDATYNTPSFYKTITGEVVLQGLVGCPVLAPNSTITILPVGYRPAKSLIVPSVKAGVPSILVIGSNGLVFCNASTSMSEWISFDNIRFRPA